MKQKVKSIISIRINYTMENPSNPQETEWIEVNSYNSSLNEFDRNGNLIKATSYDQDHEVHEFFEYKYDTNNNLIEELCYYDENELAQHKTISWYDKKLPESEKIIFQEDGSENITYFKYNEKDQLIEKRIINHDDEPEEFDTYDYDGDKLMCESHFDSDHKAVFTKKYRYNENGDIKDYEYSTPDPYEYSRMEYFYNEKGAKEKILRYNHKNQLIEKNLMEFDEHDNVIEQYEENQLSKKTTKYYYDVNHNQIKQEEYNADDIMILSIERTYNADNRLVESLIYSNDPTDGVQLMYAYRYIFEYWEE